MKTLFALSICAFLITAPLPLTNSYLSAWWSDVPPELYFASRDITQPVRIPEMATPIRPTTDLGGMNLDDLKSLGLVKEVKHTAARQFVRRRVQRPKLTKEERQILADLYEPKSNALKLPERLLPTFEGFVRRGPSKPMMLAPLLKARASEPLTTETAPVTEHELKATKFVLATFTTTTVLESDNLQTAITNAACGDTLSVIANTAGHQSVFTGAFTLPDKGCTVSTPITIQSSEAASLPSGRVSPTDRAHMPVIKTTGSSGASTFTTSGTVGWWILDGLEITDAPGVESQVQSLLGLFSNDLVVKRSYIHQKETGTATIEGGVPYHRAVIRAVQFEGTNLLFKWNYLDPFIGLYYVSQAPFNRMETTGILCISCVGLTVEDNFLSAWWNTIFMGGGDTLPQNTANLTSATTTSATFSNTTGLSAGVVIRFSFVATGTFTNGAGFQPSCDNVFPANGPPNSSGTQFVRSGGFAFSTPDNSHYGVLKTNADSYDLLIGLCTASGNNYTLAKTRSTTVSTDGAATLTIYETAIVTSVVGSTVNYTPYGRDLLASNGATVAHWNYGDQGLVTDIDIKKNTFYIEPTFADWVFDNMSETSPKGVMEIKSANRWTLEGNYILGYPSIIAIYPGNQYGTSPWTTAKYITIKNNWFAPDTGYPETTRSAMSLIDATNYATVAPRHDFYVFNNLFKGGVRDLLQTKQSDTVQAYHNTVINTHSSDHGYNDAFVGLEAPTTNFVFRDNIINWVLYGANCQVEGSTFNTCWPSATFTKNVLVDVLAQGIHCGASSEWGNNANLCPVITSFDSVGFTDPQAGSVAGNYALLLSSDYKNAASDGTDPGVNWATLVAALPNAPAIVGTRVMRGVLRPRGRVIIRN